MATHLRWAALLVAALVTSRGLAPGAPADVGSTLEEFTAVAITGPPNTATTSVVEIRVTRWSTAAEKERFARELMTGGPAAFLAALTDARPVGSIQSPPSLPWPLRFARQEPTADGGRRVLIITDRPIGAWETALDSTSLEYPFSLIQLRLNRDGEGDGLMSVATKIDLDGDFDHVTLENYDASPVRLVDVRTRRST